MCRGRAHPRRGLVHPGQDHRAGGEVRGGAGDVGERIEHVIDNGPQAARSAGEKPFELLEFVGAGHVGRLRGCGQRGLAGQERAEVALDGLHIDTLADVAAPGELALHRSQHHRLARIAGCVDVGNVVASRL